MRTLKPNASKGLMGKILTPVKRLVFTLALIGSVAYISAYTPLFSKIGLIVLNRLPIPNTIHTAPSRTPQENSHVHSPTAYVVLGGGLTEYGTLNNYLKPADITEQMLRLKDENIFKPVDIDKHTTVLNHYSLSRLSTVLTHYQTNPLLIVVSGVEAPWMHEWLLAHDIHQVVTENASMNTCENARFTAKRLPIKNVYLVTDAYHMTRARRQFALSGIDTIPLPAPLPTQTSWKSPSSNLKHSRRTVYELAAYTRDILRPQQNCRHADDVSFKKLTESRKPEGVQTF